MCVLPAQGLKGSDSQPFPCCIRNAMGGTSGPRKMACWAAPAQVQKFSWSHLDFLPNINLFIHKVKVQETEKKQSEKNKLNHFQSSPRISLISRNGHSLFITGNSE